MLLGVQGRWAVGAERWCVAEAAETLVSQVVREVDPVRCATERADGVELVGEPEARHQGRASAHRDAGDGAIGHVPLIGLTCVGRHRQLEDSQLRGTERHAACVQVFLDVREGGAVDASAAQPLRKDAQVTRGGVGRHQVGAQGQREVNPHLVQHAVTGEILFRKVGGVRGEAHRGSDGNKTLGHDVDAIAADGHFARGGNLFAVDGHRRPFEVELLRAGRLDLASSGLEVAGHTRAKEEPLERVGGHIDNPVDLGGDGVGDRRIGGVTLLDAVVAPGEQSQERGEDKPQVAFTAHDFHSVSKTSRFPRARRVASRRALVRPSDRKRLLRAQHEVSAVYQRKTRRGQFVAQNHLAG